MASNLDIHQYERKLRSACLTIERSSLSSEEKNRISAVLSDCKLKEQLSISRRIRFAGTLLVFQREYLGNGFRDAAKKDLVLSLQQRKKLLNTQRS